MFEQELLAKWIIFSTRKWKWIKWNIVKDEVYGFSLIAKCDSLEECCAFSSNLVDLIVANFVIDLEKDYCSRGLFDKIVWDIYEFPDFDLHVDFCAKID